MNNQDKSGTVVEVRPYTLKELAKLYKVYRGTFRRWLEPFRKEIGERNGNFFNVTQVATIFRLIEPPFSIIIPNDIGTDPVDNKTQSRPAKTYAKVHSVGKLGRDSFSSHDF